MLMNKLIKMLLGVTIMLSTTLAVDVNNVDDLVAAADAANPGDTIVIAEGTYYLTSQIEIKSDVTYQGAGADLTIIDCNFVTRAFVAWGTIADVNGVLEQNDDDGPTGWVLDGMTIQNAVSDAEDGVGLGDDGGAVYIEHSAEGIIQNCTFKNCLAEDDGGAILCAADDANQVWTNLVFMGNSAGDDGGAVMYMPNRAELIVTNCAFISNGKIIEDSNEVPRGDDGGAWADGDDDAGHKTFTNCVFAHNVSNDDRIIYFRSPFTMLDCSLINNVAGDEAIIGQRGQNWDSDGDDIDDMFIHYSYIDTCMFINNVMLSNKEVIGDTRSEDYAPVVTNCLFFGNLDQNDEWAIDMDENTANRTAAAAAAN